MLNLQEITELLDSAQALLMHGDDAAGIALALKGLHACELSGVVSGQGRAFNMLGIAHMQTGDLPKAFGYLQRALTVSERLGDSGRIASTLHNIGMVLTWTADYPGALDYLRRAQELNEISGDHQYLGNNYAAIGVALVAIEDREGAIAAFQKALVLYEQINDRHGVGNMYECLGDMYASMNDLGQALRTRLQALEELKAQDDVPLTHKVITDIAKTLIEMGRLDEAMVFRDRARELPIYRPIQQINANDLDAAVCLHNGDLDGAEENFHRNLLEIDTHGLRHLSTQIYAHLRDLALKRNDLASYVKHNNSYAAVMEETRGKNVAVKIAMQEAERTMALERKEHEKHMAVLHSTLPKHIADRVARGETVNDHHENAAVVFLDIVGFTTISDRIPSGHVVHLLEQIFTTLDAVCEKHNVVKIKTIGDSYMAVSFGIANGEERTANSGHIYDAATCALDMIASLDAIEITMPPSLGDTSWTKDVGDIRVRIGIHCGPVTAGVIGTQRMQYDVWGDTVNVASRMESTGEPGRIHVSQAFACSLLNLTPLELERGGAAGAGVSRRGTVEIKGKGQMTTYWLEGM